MGRNFKDIPIEDKINIYGNTVDGMFEEFCRKEEKFLSEAEELSKLPSQLSDSTEK